ncbi:MAG: zinc transporter ZupT [Epulopiscium sp. Nele67-Bin005]|nr:MAG: zinc transporter ZupT [Epulopiscium sp. Nele67-Bin005]
MINEHVILAFSLTLFAGLATGIGGAIALISKKMSTKFLSFALGFSAGIMIYVSFVEIFFKAQTSLISHLGNNLGMWVTVISFFAGILIISIIDKFIPSINSPEAMKTIKNLNSNPNSTNSSLDEVEQQKLMRMGLLMALAIAIHNFPEGLATFMATLEDPSVGFAIAIAIAIHNIPEGIAVAVPIYYATGNKKLAFKYSLLSGIAEPLGALIGYVLLYNFFNDLVFGIVFGLIGGIMVFISIDQLLPTAREYGEHNLSIYGFIAGMGVMALSLLLLG